MDEVARWWQWRLRARGSSAPDLTSPPVQPRYAAMLNEHVSPSMRLMGFTGTGGRYSLASSTHWLLIGFQKSAYSDRASIRFTVNVMSVSRSDWSDLVAHMPYLPARPVAGMSYSDRATPRRIGQLAGGEDRWWSVAADTDMSALALEVLHDIETFALPWLRQHER